MKDTQGKFFPQSVSCFVPEFNLRYNLSVKNGLGFVVEIPMGLFNRNTYYSLSLLFPDPETVWADGKAVGSGWIQKIGMRVPYMGLALKFSYPTQIHRNMFIQPEAGIKFMPFVYTSSSFEQEGPLAENIYYIDNEHNTTNVVWLHNCPTISQKNYAIPDLTIAVNFMVHGKKPHHNFIFGINANIGLADRVKWNYHTTEVIPSHLQSSGSYGWKSTYVGFHVGYQFMTAGARKIL
ncbi:MAG: hypothetical protein FWC10_02570 [Lentimicrobiaceae bacterium]|nr:hypothetical protein [Lentimicrobiaceae bacterium]